MKKFFKVIGILLVIFVVIPVALAFILLFDTGKMKVDYDDNFNKEDWGKALVVDSLDYAPTQKIARFEVTENDLNNLIQTSVKDNSDFNKYVSQLAIDITDDNFVVNLSGKLGFFETRAKLTAKLEKMIVSSGGVDKEAYVLTVENISLGRLSHMKDFIMFLLKQFVNDSALNALTKSLKVHTDLKNTRAFIYASDLREILADSMKETNSGKSDFYFSFINDFLDHHLMEFNFYGDDKLTIDIKLEKLTGNDYGEGEYVFDKYKMPYETTATQLMGQKLSLNVIRDALVSLLDNNIIETGDMAKLSDYLFYGYKGPSSEPSFDLTSIGITDKTAYKGFDVSDAQSVDEILTNSVSTFTDYNDVDTYFTLVNLKEIDVNKYLKSQNMLGNKYFLERTLPDGKHKVNYIALDNVYINFTSSSAVISAGLNINCLETYFTLPMSWDEESNGSKLVYRSNPAYYGATDEDGNKLLLSSETESLLFDTLKDSIKDESFFFLDDGKLIIDFANIINTAINNVNSGNAAYDMAYKNFLNNADYQVTVAGSLEDNASIQVEAIRA